MNIVIFRPVHRVIRQITHCVSILQKSDKFTDIHLESFSVCDETTIFLISLVDDITQNSLFVQAFDNVPSIY